jgi:hypothetical protein
MVRSGASAEASGRSRWLCVLSANPLPNWQICAQHGTESSSQPLRPIRQGRLAVWLNVTFCVISPALAHARRSPLGREHGLEPWVDGVVQMFVSWIASMAGVPGFCLSGPKGGRKAGS